MKSSAGKRPQGWSLVTTHGHVLACIGADPDVRMRDIADNVGITERTAAQIVNDLELAGYLTRTRVGRRNRYVIEGDRKIATPRLPRMTVGQVLALLLKALDQPLP
jgi:DNA-binding MarR family transcriptional regulator